MFLIFAEESESALRAVAPAETDSDEVKRLKETQTQSLRKLCISAADKYK